MDSHQTPWAADRVQKKPILPPQMMNILKIVGGGLVVLLLLIFALTSIFSFFSRSQAGVDFEYRVPSEVLVGEPFELEVSLSNFSGSTLKRGKLSLILPDTVVFAGSDGTLSVEEELLGDVPDGTVRQFQYRLIATGGDQSVARIKTALSYSRSNTSASFKEEGQVDVVIDRPAISVDYIVPQKIVVGQPFPIEIKARHQGRIDFSRVFISLEPPASFEINELSPEIQQNPATWILEDLMPGKEVVFNVTGTLTGTAGNFITLDTKVLVEHQDERYEVATQGANLPLTAAPLSVQVLLNGSDKATPSIGGAVSYSVLVRNNSEIPLNDVSVLLKLTSDLFDYREVRSSAFFDSTNSSFLWTAGNQAELLSIGPGETRQLSASLALRPDFPIATLIDKNYVLLAEAEARSTTIPPGVTGQVTESFGSLQSRVRGDAQFVAKAYYNETDNRIQNAGPYPPKANVPTQYTIHWEVGSQAVDLRDIEVVAFLEPQARFTGRSFTNSGIDPVYNPASGQITWSVPSVKANQGVLGPPVELVFQVEVTPSVSQVSKVATLIGRASFKATDVFVGEEITREVSALTTSLPFDTSIQGGTGRVEP